MYLYLCIYTDIGDYIGKRHQQNEFDKTASRNHFVTRQGCRNAWCKICDLTNRRHINHAISVDRIVKELQLGIPSPVIAYKPQGIVKEEYSLLREQFSFGANDTIPSRLENFVHLDV